MVIKRIKVKKNTIKDITKHATKPAKHNLKQNKKIYIPKHTYGTPNFLC